MEATIHFEPKQVILEGTITIADKDGSIIEEYENIFAYKWNEFGELIDLLP